MTVDPKGWQRLGSLHPGVRYDWPPEVPTVCTRAGWEGSAIQALMGTTLLVHVLVPLWVHDMVTRVALVGLGGISYPALLMDLMAAHAGWPLAVLRVAAQLSPEAVARRVKTYRQGRSMHARARLRAAASC